MLKSFDRLMEEVADDLRRMAELVETAVRQATAAVTDRDGTAAAAVLAGDDAIDRLEIVVMDRCHRILALYQPVARDLRRVIAFLQASVELERMGDLASSVAERAVRMLDFPPVPVPARLGPMVERVVEMVHAGLEAFLGGDARLARVVRGQDDEVDADNAACIAVLVERMRDHPTEVEPALSLFSAVRHLERIADHATNIAEEAVFAVEGEVLRHRHDTCTPSVNGR